MNPDISLTFPDAKKDEANMFAEELKGELRRTAPNAPFEKRKEKEAAQDAGTILVALASTAAAASIARGIAVFIGKHGSKIVIKIGNTTVSATGDATKDAASIVTAIQQSSNK